MPAADAERRLGLLGATGVGVGAIVGGGILALAGVAFATTGPAAMLAFAVNGMIALLTALSFAEIAAKFPESGGTYTFAKKVLSIEAAFTVGWVVWFASIVAAVLYALGFAHFSLVALRDLCQAAGRSWPAWLATGSTATGLAVITTALLSLGLTRRAAGGGQWANVGKVAVFGVLIVAGLWAVVRQPVAETTDSLQPFFSAGFGGLIQAMGYSFIALQGFDLIAAVGGEVRQPEKNLPRAMILSLGIALAIYLPLLFVITTVGTVPGESIAQAAAADPENIIAVAAQRFLGPFGYWLVLAAAILSMFSALQANLYAASRIARAMARDRTLPARLAVLSARHGTPAVAVMTTAVVVAVVLLILPNVATAGAASSLIFLVTFALAHWIAILVRQRSLQRPSPFRVRLFPLTPVIGGLACLGLAVFQGIAVPSAGLIAVVWLGLGGILFLVIFARRARLTDASSRGTDPELWALHGHTPLVLVPIANPRNAESMITLAGALVPTEFGRVVVMNVVVAPIDWQPDADAAPVERSQEVLYQSLTASARLGIRVEMLTTAATDPVAEIARVARLHRCQSVLVGLSSISPETRGSSVELLLDALDADVVVLRARTDWKLAEARKILVPVAGRGGHEYLLARLLGSLQRTGRREVTFLRVLPSQTPIDVLRRARRDLQQFAADEAREPCGAEVALNDDPLLEVTQRADDFDLVILGVQRVDRRKKLFGNFTRELAARSSCPLVVISRRG